MTLRTAPIVRVLGGISLAVLCVHLAMQQTSGQWNESPPPTAEEAGAVPDEAPSTATRPAAPAAPAQSAPSAVDSALASCGSSCGGAAAAPVELSWGAGQVAAARVSAAPVEDTPPARGADVAVAFAQTAAQSAMPAAAPGERGWPSQPAVSTPPGNSGWLEPVVSALLEPDPAPPTPTGTDTPLPTPPQGEATTPMAVPLVAQPTPAGVDPWSPIATPITPAGAPFKRTGQPGDKAGGRAPAPLAGAPVFHPYLPARGQGGQGGEGGGEDPSPSGLPFADTPSSDAPFTDSPGRAPADVPSSVPDWVPAVSGPGQAPVFGHTPLPGAPAPWVPLLSDPPLVDRVAAGPRARPEDLLTPALEPAATPLDAVVAAVVTEPGSLALLAIAALGLAGLQRQAARGSGARRSAPEA